MMLIKRVRDRFFALTRPRPMDEKKESEWKALGLAVSRGAIRNSVQTTQQIIDGLKWIRDGWATPSRTDHMWYRALFGIAICQLVKHGPNVRAVREAIGERDFNAYVQLGSLCRFRLGIATIDLASIGMTWAELSNLMTGDRNMKSCSDYAHDDLVEPRHAHWLQQQPQSAEASFARLDQMTIEPDGLALSPSPPDELYD